MICLNWNLEWALRDSKAGRLIHGRVSDVGPDVACFTEVTLGMLPECGHFVDAGSEWGYPHDGSRRKVVLWSREPWTEVESVGSGDLPSGRFVSGVTGRVRFVGVCIPWRDAHVRTGRRDRNPWQDHLAYLAGLKQVLEAFRNAGTPVCVVGDYNQRIPRVRQPWKVAEALDATFGGGLEIATRGVTDSDGDPLIDHFAHTAGLVVRITGIIPKRADDGTRLSDHAGVVVSLTPHAP